MRHKETEAFIGCVMGFIVILTAFIIGFLNANLGFVNLALMGGGFILMVISFISSQYYSGKVKTLMRNYSNLPEAVALNTASAPPTSNVCPICHRPLSFIEQNQTWYCFNCVYGSDK